MKKNRPLILKPALYSIIAIVLSEIILHIFLRHPLEKNEILQKYNIVEFFEPLAIVFSILFGLIVNIVLILNWEVLDRIPNIESLVHKMDSQSDLNKKLFNSLRSENERIQEIFLHLNSRYDSVKNLGRIVIDMYLSGFRLVPHGFHVIGEYWALKTYVKIWEFLADEQKKKKISNDPQFIIARVTHSNDINIWLDTDQSYQAFSHDLYFFQKEFTKYGGRIVRMLIGPEPSPNDEYSQAIKKMESLGMEVKYFWQKEIAEREFDFLYLPDEKIVLKWFSGTNGRRLAGCIIEDKIEDEVRFSWNDLFYKAEDKGDPVKSIPKDREYDRQD